MKKIVRYCLVATLGLSVVACGSNEPKAENGENHENHEGHDHDGDDHMEAEGVTGNLKVDSEMSSLKWEGGILNVGDEFIKSHNGTIMIKDGEVQMENGAITAGKIVVDMTSITPLDDNYEPEEGKTKDKLVGHLSSADFFNVEEFPEAYFKISEVRDNVARGEMTIRGVTNAEEIENFVVNTTDDKTVVSGDMTIDRQKYGVSFDLGAQDMFLSDNIKLSFNTVLK